jgi:hypothetical protein
MMDKIDERNDSGLCPLCAKEIGEDFKRVLYKGRKVSISKHHRIPEDKEEVQFKPIAERAK